MACSWCCRATRHTRNEYHETAQEPRFTFRFDEGKQENRVRQPVRDPWKGKGVVVFTTRYCGKAAQYDQSTAIVLWHSLLPSFPSLAMQRACRPPPSLLSFAEGQVKSVMAEQLPFAGMDDADSAAISPSSSAQQPAQGGPSTAAVQIDDDDDDDKDQVANAVAAVTTTTTSKKRTLTEIGQDDDDDDDDDKERSEGEPVAADAGGSARDDDDEEEDDDDDDEEVRDGEHDGLSRLRANLPRAGRGRQPARQASQEEGQSPLLDEPERAELFY